MVANYGSAAEVVKAAVAALEAERWGEIVPLVRPEALQTLRDTQLRWMLALERRAPRTTEALRAEQPWLTRDVAASYAEQEQKHLSGSLPTLRSQWGVASLSELEAISPAEFFVRYLSAATPAAKLRAALAVSHNPPHDMASAMASAEAAHRRGWSVLGEVLEGARTAHVVFRERTGEAGHGAVDEAAGVVRVTTLDHANGRWWLRIDHTLLDAQASVFAWAPDASPSNNTG